MILYYSKFHFEHVMFSIYDEDVDLRKQLHAIYGRAHLKSGVTGGGGGPVLRRLF